MPALVAMPDTQVIDAETPADAPAVEAVVTRAFGPGRYAKTAERLREGRVPAVGLVARDNGAVIGSVRLWDIAISGTPALFLGPIAVERASRSDGVGARLVEAAVEAARARDVSGVLLVGDQGFFGRLGFACIDGPVMPGPVDPARLFWMGFGGEAPAGPVLPA